MKSYKTKKGVCITVDELREYELNGLSENSIGGLLGISRMQLYKIRRKLGCIRKIRSHKGVVRVSAEDKRVRWNAYMREYRVRKKIEESKGD